MVGDDEEICEFRKSSKNSARVAKKNYQNAEMKGSAIMRNYAELSEKCGLHNFPELRENERDPFLG